MSLEPGSLKDELKGKFEIKKLTKNKLQRKSLGENLSMHLFGSPLVPKPKPYTLEQFQEKADLYMSTGWF